MNTHVITTLRERVNIAASKWPARQWAHYSRQVMMLALTIIALATLARPGFARSSPGFTSFKIQYPLTPVQVFEDPLGYVTVGYNCMKEDYGAVWNDCGVTVYVMFDLSVDTAGTTHPVTVSTYWNGSGSTGVSCTTWAYNDTGFGSVTPQPPQQFPAHPQATATWSSPIVFGGQTMTLFCTLPPTQGIASVTWAP